MDDDVTWIGLIAWFEYEVDFDIGSIAPKSRKKYILLLVYVVKQLLQQIYTMKFTDCDNKYLNVKHTNWTLSLKQSEMIPIQLNKSSPHQLFVHLVKFLCAFFFW